MKQAVVLIHGIGEQKPMDTLRGFVEAVWLTDKDIHNKHSKGESIFSKPDSYSNNTELRRFTTFKNINNKRTDFYEFYWAHLMEGNQVSHVLAWLKNIVIRNPLTLPKKLRPIWLIIILSILAIIYFTITPFSAFTGLKLFKSSKVSLAIGSAILAILGWFTKKFLGDAARYFDASPDNVKQRQEIKAKGLELLEKLHTSGEYDRVIIVGHSLGSAIGYDLINHYWHKVDKGIKNKSDLPILEEVEEAIFKGNFRKFNKLQKSLLKEQQSNNVNWLISDFITLGSPLTYSEVLLAKNKDNLCQKIKQREITTCPPILEGKKISYTKEDSISLHHASAFSITKWSNIYFPSKYIIFGDIVGGPLQSIFGHGIVDIPVKSPFWSGLIAHVFYWKQLTPKSNSGHIEQLRKAINLTDND